MCPESYAVHFPGVAIETAQKSAQEWPCHQPGKRKAGRTTRSRQKKQNGGLRERSGAEKNGFALKHFYGEEEGDGGIDTSRRKDDGDVVPVIGAGYELFAEQTDVQNWNERELGGKLHAGKHGGDGREDDDESHRREITLSLFVGLGEERDGHQGGGEQHGYGEGHEEDGNYRLGAEVEEKFGSSSAAAGRLGRVVT